MKLSPSEKDLLKILWEYPQGLYFLEIRNMVQKEWSTSTLATFLRRLEEKGYVEHIQQGRKNFYLTAITEEEYEKKEKAKQLKTKVTDLLDSVGAALCKRPLNREQIKETETCLKQCLKHLEKLEKDILEEKNND